jgi:hypothetical protein
MRRPMDKITELSMNKNGSLSNYLLHKLFTVILILLYCCCYAILPIRIDLPRTDRISHFEYHPLSCTTLRCTSVSLRRPPTHLFPLSLRRPPTHLFPRARLPCIDPTPCRLFSFPAPASLVWRHRSSIRR